MALHILRKTGLQYLDQLGTLVRRQVFFFFSPGQRKKIFAVRFWISLWLTPVWRKNRSSEIGLLTVCAP
jgi:hypothetical protein